ncbi:MAG: hypothetical protein JWR15_2845 [Prosthecobacter sp.]|nr:hypothetical protein [Prosthecobacter sp.]
MKIKPAVSIACAAALSAWVLAQQPAAVQQPGGKEHDHSTLGAEKTAKTKLLEAGAELLQGEGPINAIHAHVCGFHFYADDMKRQIRSHHYCSHKNEEVLQCVIYDSHDKNARLIGIEYIISEELFKTLPTEEKKLWHSHQYEVMSGQLVAPGIPAIAENELMQKLVTTYGKTWHTWQIDRGEKLPLGLPKLMMGFTADGQGDAKMIAQRDKDFGVDSNKKKSDRAEKIKPGTIAEGADAWQKGGAFQISDDLLQQTPAQQPAGTAPAK